METPSSQSRDAVNTSREKLLHYFLETCSLSPHSAAIITGIHRLSYVQLQKAALQVQSILKDVGVRQSQLIAICIPRSAALVAAILGCVLHGAVFLLVDPSLPSQRMQVLFEISRPCAVLYSVEDHPKIESVLHTSKSSILAIGIEMEEDHIITSNSSRNIVESFVCGDDVLYIIFTSGSTGIPKAVCASTSGTLNRFEWMWKEFPFQPNDVVCFKTSVNFVDCIWEILGTVLKGAPLAIPLEEEAKDPRLLVAFMKKCKVTRVTFVPSYLRHVLEFPSALESLQFLTHCISSGEPLSLSLAAMFLKAAPSCKLLNLYGTSEICGDVTYFEVTRQYLEQTSSSFVPIGKPIPNVYVEVIDPTTGKVITQNSSKEGELVTFGNCVAHSYLNSDDKSLAHTNDRSIFNTHDLVHYNSSGDLMYIGRRDHQIKVRGVRINPSEIEAVLEKNSSVERAVVVADESHMNLISFIQINESHCTSKESSAVIEYGGASFFTNTSLSGAIATELLTLLPQYLVPSLYVFTHKLPTLPSGKVSRKELPPSSEIKKLFSESVSESIELSKTEEQLCCIFKEILKLTGVSLVGNFFALGGNSLSAVDLASSIQECFHFEVSVATILANPTIQSLAVIVDKSSIKNEAEPLSAALQQALTDYTGPMSYSQECIWCYEAIAPCPLYELGTAAICLKSINPDIIQKSIHQLASKHESLRTIYGCTIYGHPFQKVMKYENPEFTSLLTSAFVIIDCSSDCPLGFEGNEIILPSFKFNLIQGPLWRFTLFTNVAVPGASGFCSIIAFQAHHMMTDGWSIQLLTRDFEEIYTRISNSGEDVIITPNPSIFLFAIKHAISERSRCINKELQLWQTKFHNALLPPFLHPKCLHLGTYTGSSSSSIHKTFASSMTEIRSFCQANGISEFVAVFTSLLTSIYALNGNIDVLASLILAIRNSENAKIPVYSVDSFPLRITFDEDFSLHSLLSTVKAGILEVMENQISWYQLEKALMKRGEWMPNSSFSSGVVNQLGFIFDYKSSMPFFDSKLFQNIPVQLSACESLIDFNISAGTDTLDIHVAYSLALYDAQTVQRLLGTWERVMETMVKHVYLNVPLKNLCRDICKFRFEEASIRVPQPEACIGCKVSPIKKSDADIGTVAVSLNTDDMVTWSQLTSIQASMMSLMNSSHLLSSHNCPTVIAHLPFSAFAIALITVALKMKCDFASCSSLDDIVGMLADISKNGLPCLVIVRNIIESEQIKKYCASNIVVVTAESFQSICPSNSPVIDFTVCNSRWQSDLLSCSEAFSMYFTESKISSTIALTSQESATLPIVVSFLLRGIPVQIYSFDNIASFVKVINETAVDSVLIPEISVPSTLPEIVGCKGIKHLWIHGLPLGLAYVSKWITALQHIQVIVTHSLVPEQHLITHHFNLKDIPFFEDGSIPCIPIGSMCKGLNGKVLHRDGRDVCRGFVGSFATMENDQVYQSTSLVRQLPKDGSFELVSVNAEAYYRGIDVTPALFVLCTIPEVSWCGVSTGTGRDNIAVLYSSDVESSELASLHYKITQQFTSTLSLAYAGLLRQLSEPPPITSNFIAPVDQLKFSDTPDIHWLYGDPVLAVVNDPPLPDKIVELVSKSFDTDPETVRLTPDLLSIGGNSTAIILDLTDRLNIAFDAHFTIPAVYQAVRDGHLLSLVVNAGNGQDWKLVDIVLDHEN